MAETVLIGLGMVADMHVAAIAATGGQVRLRGVLARDPARAAAFRDRAAPAAQVYESVAEVAADPSIDFAILATPPNAREAAARALAAAGKPILTEKPVERDAARARAIVAICAEAGVPLGVILQHRMRPAAQTLAARLRAEAFGRVHAVEIAVPWWRDQAYYDAPGRGTYGRDGGGVLISQAIHTLDLALHLAGPVARVQAMARTTGAHRMEAEDFVAAGFDFASGAVGSLTASTAAFPGGAERITLHCDKASATLDAAALTIHWRDGRVEAEGGAAGSGGGADPMAFTHDWHRAMIQDFAEALAADRPPAVTGAAALQVHDLIDALTRSSREGRAIEVEAAHG